MRLTFTELTGVAPSSFLSTIALQVGNSVRRSRPGLLVPLQRALLQQWSSPATKEGLSHIRCAGNKLLFRMHRNLSAPYGPPADVQMYEHNLFVDAVN